mmetsp:Transcript_33701/g.62029  ORF Transcript_33701/g.62029 Transcript_33701/m.62029 type:complete len:92 (-) Transcript_33701:12-287(-)
MGTPLSFLPFSGKEEFKKYAKFDAAAVLWCESYVDGLVVLPKLPSRLRTHRESWDRNQRVKRCGSLTHQPSDWRSLQRCCVPNNRPRLSPL